MAQELKLDAVEKALSIPYVQAYPDYDPHKFDLNHSKYLGRSYINPAHDSDWKKQFCYLVFYGNKVGKAKKSGSISLGDAIGIRRSIERDYKKLQADDEEANGVADVMIGHQTRRGIAANGLAHCDG